MPQSLGTLLELGLQEMGLPLPDAVRDKLIRFIALLEKWNRIYNLTAIRDPRQMVTHHLLDSLAILPFVNGPRVLDIGTGAGLPGIPLALARPELHFTLLDSNAKKTRFVTQACGELDIHNVTVIHERVERYRPGEKFDTLISRAFSNLAEMVEAAKPLCAERGEFLAMKGRYPHDELARLSASYLAAQVRALHVPGLSAERHAVRIVAREVS